MNRLALLLVLAASACVADGGDEGFSIAHNLVPGENCMVSPGAAFNSRGTIDIEGTNGYVLTPEIQSRITAEDGASVAQRTIVLRGARVEVLDVTGGAEVSIGKFTSLFSASVEPLGATGVAFDIITPQMLTGYLSTVTAENRVQLLAKVTPYGALGGSGEEFDGVQFQYPVTVCRGCVAQNVGACPLPSNAVIIDRSHSCNPFQDGFVQCCDANGTLICPAVKM